MSTYELLDARNFPRMNAAQFNSSALDDFGADADHGAPSMRDRTTRTLRLSMAFMLAGGLVACGVAAPAAGRPPGLKTITWYTAHNPEQVEDTVEAFEALNPQLRVNTLRLVTGELAVRYAQERTAGSSTADVITLSDPSFISSGSEAAWWERDVDVDPGWPEGAISDGVAHTGIFSLVVGINSDQIRGNDVPSSWADLMDESLRGRIMVGDLRGVPSYLAMAELWSREYGDDFLVQLAEQDLRWVAGMVPGNQNLASGATGVLLPNARAAATTLVDAGAPIQLVELSPMTGIEYYSVVPDDAPNRAAAELFFAFLTTREGQNAFNGSVGSSPRDDATTYPLPQAYVPLAEVLPAALEREELLLELIGLAPR